MNKVSKYLAASVAALVLSVSSIGAVQALNAQTPAEVTTANVHGATQFTSFGVTYTKGAQYSFVKFNWTANCTVTERQIWTETSDSQGINTHRSSQNISAGQQSIFEPLTQETTYRVRIACHGVYSAWSPAFVVPAS